MLIFFINNKIYRLTRASSCSHLQCFDASLYLQMNERKPTWNCPVCDKPAIYENLVIDGYALLTHTFAHFFFMLFPYKFRRYFQEVLGSSNLSSDTNEIQLHTDGSWSVNVQSDSTQNLDTPCKQYSKVEVISDDLGKLDDILHTSIDKTKINNIS